MGNQFFDFFEKFATDFTWKRAVVFFAMLALIVIGFYLYESATATNQLTKYERTIKILQNLEKINTTNKNIQNVVDNINAGLFELTDHNFKINKNNSKIKIFNISIPIIVKQILLNVSGLLFMALFIIPSGLKGDEESYSALGGIAAFIFLISLLSYFSFDVMQTWLGFYLSAIVMNLIPFVILMLFNTKQKNKNSGHPQKNV